MIRSLRNLVLATAVIAAGCDSAPRSRSANTDAAKTAQTGVASFYGREFSGRETASGERLKLDAMTAASRTLPLGTHVQVTNVETGKSAKVRINDRGPYAKGRVLDLTPKAAQTIGIDRKEGVAEVRVKPVPTQEAAAP